MLTLSESPVLYTRGIDQSAFIAAPNSYTTTLTLSPTSPLVHHMTVTIGNHLDGAYEAIKVANQFSHPSLTFGQSESRTPPNTPSVVYFRGVASADVYIEALQNLVYTNAKLRPTPGDRIISVTVYDGQSTNQNAYTIVTVAIQNVEPIVQVNGDGTSYSNRFFPHEGPVAAVNPSNALVTDTDSQYVRSMTLQLHNALNGPSETLSVTYVTPETLSLPIIAAATQLSIPFGTLWRGEIVPTITSTIKVAEMGVVGHLSVTIDIRHSWVGDLMLELEHNGRRELLVSNPGGRVCNQDNLARATFESRLTSSDVFLSRSNPSAGICRFQSEGLFTADGDLDSFHGDPIEGDWLLHITDLLLENDNGRLFGWSLSIQPEEEHAVIAHPPVLPPLKVGGARNGVTEFHEKTVELDGRIFDISVYVQLGVDSTAEQLYLPTLTLVHPDGSRVDLSYWSTPYCALGNYTNLVFSDRGESSAFSCDNVLNPMSGPGSSSSSSSGSDSGSGSGMEVSTIMDSSGGSALFNSGSGINNGMYLNLDDIYNLNISIPYKYSQVDLLNPAQPLRSLFGKMAGGEWTLVLNSGNELESTLYGWSLRIAREPNINENFDSATNTFYLTGDDSVSNYQKVFRSIVYDNQDVQPDFSLDRWVTVVTSDGQSTSNETLPSSQSRIIVHHIDINLDPLNTTSELTPDFAVTFREHGTPIPILDSSNALLRDTHFSTGVYTLSVTLRGYSNYNKERLLFNASVVTGLQALVTNSTVTDEQTVIVTATWPPEPIEKFEAVLRTFEYFNSAEEFAGNSRAVDFRVTDIQMGSLFVSAVATTTITLQPTNDVPVLLLNSYRYSQSDQFSNIVDYTEGQGSIALTNATSIILTDNDHDYLVSVAVTITNPLDPQNEFLQANTTGTSITAAYNQTSYTLVLNGNGTLATYISVLGTVTYENTIHSPGMPGTDPRQVTFVPNDGTHRGRPAISLITFAAVNDAAFGDLNGAENGTGFETVFTEEGGSVRIVSENTTLYDVDDITLAFIEVRITNVQDQPYEILSVMDVQESSDQNSKVVEFTNLRPVTSYDTSSGYLRISGLDTVREYQEVLKTLTYSNLADEPSPLTREIAIVLNDAHSQSTPLISVVNIELVNDSPYFNQQLTAVQDEIFEDIPNSLNFGVSVFEIAESIIDDDVNSVSGIAVIRLDDRFGTWQYTIDGLVWTDISGNVTLNFALALEALIGVAIRFVPEENWNGIAQILLVAWDGTDSSVEESYINAESNSNIDAFSSNSTVVTVIVRPVNDAPILLPIPLNITTISEDNFNSFGDPVLDLVRFVTDDDQSSEFGIAIIEVDDENGAWQFTTDGGMSWAEFGIVNETLALLLHSLPEGSHRIRFVPEQNFNGESSFQFHAWDLTRLPDSAIMEQESVIFSSGSSSSSGSGSSLFSGGGGPVNVTVVASYPSGSRINISNSHLITGPFSMVSTSVTIVIEPLNDSPVIEPGMTLREILEDIDPSMNHGTTVDEIIAGLYTDNDVSPDRGLAVIGVDDRYGNWQYTCENPRMGNWSDFIGGMYYGQVIPRLPQPEMATLLLASCWIRFLPNTFFNSQYNTEGYPRVALPYLQTLGWDNTGATTGRSGSYGNDATYASDFTSNEYSGRSEIITISVLSVNNVPILRLTNETQADYSAVFVEDLLPVYAVGRDLTLIDNDHARLRDVTVTIYGSTFDVSPFNDLTFSGDESNSGSGSGVSGSGSGLSGSGSGLIGSGLNPSDEYVPVISSTPDYPPLDRVQAYVQTLDSPTELELYCSGQSDRREELLVQTTSPDLISEVINYCPYVLRLYANPTVAPDAHKDMFQLALRSLKYNNSIQEPMGGDRTLTFVVSDNVGLSEPVNSTIFVQLVNDMPQLDLNDLLPDVNNFVSYTEGQSSLLLANETTLRLIDTDNAYLQYAQISLIEAPDALNEVLNATVDGTGLNIDFNATSHTLTLFGNVSIATYATVLSSVTYSNLNARPGNPNERQREAHFLVSDGDDRSRVAITYISFTGVNNKPYLDVNGNAEGVNYTATFVEEQDPVSIVDENALVQDIDNSTLAYIVVQLLDQMEILDEFLYVDNVTLMSMIEGSGLSAAPSLLLTTIVPRMTYDDFNGILVISGLDTVEEYQLVLRTIKYDNRFDEPIPFPRTIQFTASDGQLNSTSVYTELTIEPFNDSPYFNTTLTNVYSPLILEDEFNNDGVMVAMFAHQLFVDKDMQFIWNRPGIGVVSLESDHGEWERSIDGGQSWMLIRPDTNIESLSLLLSAELDGDNLVRFIPEENYHGNVSLTFVLWDGSDGMLPGDTRQALSTSRTDPFSNNTRTMVLRIVPVNDAPVIDPAIVPRLTNVLEDDVIERESIGDTVDTFLTPLLDDVDVDITTHHFGIAVVTVDRSHGYWQFSTSGGLNWTNISNPTLSNAVVLNSRPVEENRIRFVPDPDFNGESSFQFRLWDRNQTFTDMENVDTVTDPVTGTFSVGIATARVTVEPVNDSPTLSGPSALDEIQEDILRDLNVGTFVNTLISSTFNDIDGTDMRGVAVVYVDRRYGNWQYTCDPLGDTSWIDFRGERLVFDTQFGSISQIAPRDPNEFRATLLSGEDDSLCRIRFIPLVDYNTEFDAAGFPRELSDQPFIRIRAWDGTSGTNEQEGVDTTSSPDDHTNAFGQDFVKVTVNVLSINDRPVLNLTGVFPNYQATFVESTPPLRVVEPVSIVNQELLSLIDSDNSLLASATVSLVIYDIDNERLLLNISGTSLNYTVNVINESSVVTYIIRITPLSGETAPTQEFETALKTLLYENSAEEPNPILREVRFSVSDSFSFSSEVRTELSITLINDPPQLDLAMNWPDSYRFVSYREGQGPLVIVNDNATLVDFDSPVLESARVVIVIAPDMEQEILNATSDSNIVVTRNGSELLLLGPAAVDEFLTVIKTVSYENTLSHPGDPSPLSRTIQFTVSDGLNQSIPAFVFLSFGTINNAPFLDANGRQPGISNLVTFYEERGPVTIVQTDAVLEDIDNATLSFVRVRIVNPLDGDNEVLYVEDVVTETSAPLTSKEVVFFNYRAQQQYDVATATLTITGLETVYEFQEVLKTLKYDNLADEPNTSERSVEFVLSDGVLNRTGVYVTIVMENVNDSPYFNSSATVFSPTLDEDTHSSLNAGWSIEEVVSNQLILDDDADSLEGIAVIATDTTNGYWEITWDYTMDPSDMESGSGDLNGMEPGSGDQSGMEPVSGDQNGMESGSGNQNGMESGFDGLQPVSGSGSVVAMDGSGSDSSTSGSGSSTSGSDSSTTSGGTSLDDVSGSGIMMMSGSGMFESGDFTETPPTSPPPKCTPTEPMASPNIQQTFYATWYRLSDATSITMATVIRVDGNRTRIRFVPSRNFNGQTSFDFVAWDVSNGLSNGELTNASSSSPIDSYSSASVQLLLTVLPVNDAPLLNNVTVQLTTIQEDDITSSGNDISDFLSGVSDIDVIDITFGIAIVEADETKGAWQVTTNGGRDWNTLREVCPYNATVMTSEPPGENRVRFLPNRDFNGNVSFTFVAWDLSSGEPSSTTSVDTTTSDSVTGAYSNIVAMATIIVESVNDSPVLTPGARLPTILEDMSVAENEGVSIWNIVDGFYHDVDTLAVRGIAVRDVDLRYGIWEWKCPDTNVWTKFFGDFLYGVFVPPSPRPEKATLLDGFCSVRFLPDLNFNTLRDTNGDLRPLSDRPFITVVAWDTTIGSPGTYGIDTTAHNDSIINEYSAEMENVIIEVTSINDLPEVSISEVGAVYRTAFTEEQAFVNLVDPVFVSVRDVDHARFESVAVIVINSVDEMAEMVLFDTQALLNDSNIELDADTNTIIVTVTNEDGIETTETIQVIYHIQSSAQNSPPSSLMLRAPPGRRRVGVASYEYLLQYIVYSNANNEPNNETRIIEFYFNDSEDITMVTTEVDILLLNDNAPILTNPRTNVQFTEDSGVLLSLASDNLTLTDSDHSEYFFVTNATISLYPVPTSGLENVTLDVTPGAADLLQQYNISLWYIADEGLLRMLGQAPVSAYQSLLQTAVYQNTIEEPLPGDRTVTMQVFDGDNHSNVQRVRVAVVLINDQVPIVITPDSRFVFTERTRPVAIGNGIIVTDQDSGDFPLNRVTVTIDNPLDGTYEMLSVDEFENVNATYDESTLTLTGPSSAATLQSVLSTLRYNNMAEEPSPATRNISILIYDEDFVSQSGVIRVAIQLINDVPVLRVPSHELVVNYVEGSGRVAIATNATITDNDHSELMQLTVLNLNPLDQPNEYLSVSIATTSANITSDYNPDNGLLIINGNASISDYQDILRTLSYENTEADPGFPDTAARMVQTVVFDGSNYSIPLLILVTFESVNDPPMLDLNGPTQTGLNNTVSFVEEGVAVAITTPDAVLFDIDNTSLAFVRITIENLQDNENEILSISTNTSEELDLAFYSYDNGVLLIEGLGETVNFEQVVASVMYRNLADEPTYTTRVISFIASDGLSTSEVVYANVEMIPINDPPRLYIAGGLVRPRPPTEAPTETTGSGMEMSGSGVFSGSSSGSDLQDLMSGSGSGSPPTTQMPTQPPTQEPQPTLDPDTILENVTIGNGGDYSVIYVENSLPVTIVDVNGTLIEDDDDVILTRLEVVLNNIQDPGFEAIFFDSNSLSNELVAKLFTSASPMGGYLGNDITCVTGFIGLRHEKIDINISLSIFEWEEVVRSLRYCSGDEHPVSGSRNITFQIQDSSMAWSNIATTIVEVVAVNDAPICTTIPNLFTIDEDTNLTIAALQNCFDHEEVLTPQAVRVFTLPSKGSISLDSNTGDLVFIPMLDDYGTRTFAYQACDSTNFCSNPQMVTVIINPVNDPPYAFKNLTISTPEDTFLEVQLSQFFGDVEDDLLPGNRYPRVNGILNIPLARIAFEDDQNSTMMYIPAEDFNGNEELVIEVCDSDDACVEITIQVVVVSVNDVPDIRVLYPEDVSPVGTDEDTTVTVDVLITEVEDREPVTVTVEAVGGFGCDCS